MTISHRTDETLGRVTYVSSDGATLVVWRSDLVHAAYIASHWYQGRSSALFGLACGDYAPLTVARAAVELARALLGAHVPTENRLEAEVAMQTLSHIEDWMTEHA